MHEYYKHYKWYTNNYVLIQKLNIYRILPYVVDMESFKFIYKEIIKLCCLI